MTSSFDGLKLKERSIEGAPLEVVIRSRNPFTSEYVQTLSHTSEEVRQSTLSEGHPWPSASRRLKDIGGPFKTTRRFYALTPNGSPVSLKEAAAPVRYDRTWASNYYDRVTGLFSPLNPGDVNGALYGHPIIRSTNDDVWPQAIESSEYELTTLGATAISRCKPTNAPAELAVGLAEVFREGIPKVPGSKTWRDRALTARNAGDEYLNYQFGWAPLVSEVVDSVGAIARADQIWRQYKRDAGRVVRRSYAFPVQKSREDRPNRGVNFFPPLSFASPSSGSEGHLAVRRVKTVERWFDGAFTYYLPSGGRGDLVDSFLNGMYKARHVSGATLDPEVLWNLAPWSWFADWFVNAGDVISNVSDMAIDGLVMHYGYMMETSRVADELTWVGGQLSDGSSPSFKICLVTETKQRLKASPYGFGLTWESFSPRQLAILAALGITR